MAKNMVEFDFGFGDRVKSRINGFEGIVTGLDIWINGCRRICVSPEGLKDDGDPQKAHWLDQGDLVLVEAGALELAPVDSVGGPMDDPPPHGGGK